MTSLPTNTQQRIKELDIFRGFAILGIFMVNILVMNMSFAYRQEWEIEQTGWLNQATFFILESLFYSKFFAIFSFLFGIGIALQLQIDNGKSVLFFVRRLSALFLFGVLHILFIWSGDILHLYALLGVPLLLLFKLPSKYILWVAILIFLFPFFGPIMSYILEVFSIQPENALNEFSKTELIEMVRNGSYWSGLVLRVKEYIFTMPFVFAYIAPVAFSMILIGGYIVKKGYVFHLHDLAYKIRVPLLVTTGILLIYRYTLIYYILPHHTPEWGSMLSIMLHTLYQLSDVTLSFTFLWALTIFYHLPSFRNALVPLSYVGRLAFSNYILQSLFGYFLMRTLGFYASFSVFQCAILVLLFFSFQIILSKYYLNYFKFGPLEWLWRVISYWKWMSFRKKNLT